MTFFGDKFTGIKGLTFHKADSHKGFRALFIHTDKSEAIDRT